MTPLIDVLLVLLIIFMVIIPEKPLGLEARVPPDNVAEQPVDDTSVVVSVGKDKSLLINRESVRMEDLGGRLLKIFNTRALRVCFVKGDGELDFEDVAQVIDVARGAGIHHVGISTH